MPFKGKRDWLAERIIGPCRWLAKRSVRMRLLVRELAGRLLMAKEVSEWSRPPRPAVNPCYGPAELSRRTDEFNQASEDYYSRSGRDFLLGKPFTDRLGFARHLFSLGVLFHWARIAPGETVLEMGAGSCWLSHLLNRYGCKTIAVDVSETGLSIGRELFEKDPHTNWSLEPEFVAYDGYRLPIEDRSVDKIIVYDAFHHIPNYETVLREMARVLCDGGIIGMREPGRLHAGAEKSLAEVREFGVLENDIVVEELEEMARRCGLNRTTIVPLAIDGSIELPASDLGSFMEGRHLFDFVLPLCAGLDETSFILMYKGEWVADTRRPQRLSARIEPLLLPGGLNVCVAEAGQVSVRIENTGDTRWLTTIAEKPGWTRLGIRLHRADRLETLLDGEWQRAELPSDVNPGEEVLVQVELPPLETPGDYVMRFDMVAEHVAWFADRNSPTVAVPLRVATAREKTAPA